MSKTNAMTVTYDDKSKTYNVSAHEDHMPKLGEIIAGIFARGEFECPSPRGRNIEDVELPKHVPCFTYVEVDPTLSMVDLNRLLEQFYMSYAGEMWPCTLRNALCVKGSHDHKYEVAAHFPGFGVCSETTDKLYVRELNKKD